ncbi:CvpA family protein [Candidatus Liberibacter americanus]|uniref:Colicin V production protein n=1 Tax=Candidatus Liberibacter americanus str. Sao Paulo TaxID=1261131 RepID=U6B7L7_9HYPH|nr:CvpA family protein [Candidatus Liberibacter americanus]AHA27712.1 colicin V production protein [Candidatus Liberibacter americanus str. Sao Paulo]EMS36419.1 colicin V production protein [Candidatus Liberibacter americanus PW_SP]
MGITYFDFVFLAVISLSAIFAMARGIFNELISLSNWIGTAMLTYNIYPFILNAVSKYFVNQQIALISVVLLLFLTLLIIISIILKIITTPIHIRSVFLDKILGFLFGIIRGLFLLIIATSFWNLIIGDSKTPDFIKNSRSGIILNNMRVKIMSIMQYMPKNNTINDSKIY